MVNEFFTEEIDGVEVNKEGNLQFFKENSDKEKQESDEQLDTTDMPELEDEESATEIRNQQGKRLEILTPDQMVSRLTIALAELKAIRK